MRDNIFMNLFYYFSSIVLCAYFFFIGNIIIDKTFVIILVLPFIFMFLIKKEHEDIKKKGSIDKFDFASYLAGLFIDFFIVLGISLIALLTFAFLKWYSVMIMFFALLIDAFVAKNVFFTRFGLVKFNYTYKKSIGIVLKNSICIFVFLSRSKFEFFKNRIIW